MHLQMIGRHACVLTLSVLASALLVASLQAQERVRPGEAFVAPPPGPSPTNVTATGTPAKATIRWNLVNGASGYTVQRWLQANPECCRAQSPTLGASVTSWEDGPLHTSGVYVYRVTALYPDGRQGFAQLDFPRPEPRNPAWVKAERVGTGIVVSWAPVPDASRYVVVGPTESRDVPGTQTSITYPMPPGEYRWHVHAQFDPGPIETPAAQWPQATNASESGRYRVTLIGFDVNQETPDAPLEGDGKGDEVYLVAYAGTMDRQTKKALGQPGYARSATYGDVNGFSDRFLAGSRSDRGGLQTRDAYPLSGGASQPNTTPSSNQIPLVVWQGPLTDGGEVLLVAPAVWESDRNDATFAAWLGKMGTFFPQWFHYTEIVNQFSTSSVQSIVAADLDVGLDDAQMYDQDRPLGMRPVPSSWRRLLRQQVLVLTREKIEAVLGSLYRSGSLPPGVVPISLVDQPDHSTPAPNGLGGAYTLYVKFERLP